MNASMVFYISGFLTLVFGALHHNIDFQLWGITQKEAFFYRPSHAKPGSGYDVLFAFRPIIY